MAKKKSWFQLVKGFFISETKAKPQKKERRRKKWFSGHFKFRSLAVIEAPQPPKERTLVQAEQEHSKHALTVAIASAAAAEAAVVAAHAAAEVVRLTGVPPRNEMRMCDFAAIKIQTAFRGYLARKALRALRGLVRLQAMVRGRAVRRQVITSLNELQSLVKIQSRVREWRIKKAEHKKIDTEKEVLVWKSKETKSNMNNKQTRCGDSLPSKEVCREIILSRQDSSIRRKRIKEYFLTHQEAKTVEKLTETELENPNKRLDQYWFEHWVDDSDKRDDEPLAFGSGLRPRGLVRYSSVSLPRRSFCQPKRYSSGDESFSRSPSVPNYMSATESAKAKARSYSTPKQRLENNSDNDSPSKNRLSFSSIGSDLSPTPVKNGKHPTCSQQISPRMRGLLGPIKSHKSSKDLSVDSECSLLTLERNNGFR